MTKNSTPAHISAKTLLPAAIHGWEMFLYDQGRSPNTVKAFLSDVRLLTQFAAPDQTIGAVTTDDLNRFFEWMEKDVAFHAAPRPYRGELLRLSLSSAGCTKMEL